MNVELPDDRAYHVYDFWQKKYLGVHRQALMLSQPPHATALLILTTTGSEPNLIASTFHLASGYREVKSLERSHDRLCLELEKAGRQKGELVFALTRDWKNRRVRVNGRRGHGRKIAEGIIGVRLSLDERAEVELEA